MKVSVIIPVFNAERFLEKAIISALEQPETGEVLLVDDKSSDSSPGICKRFEREDKRVRFLQHPDKGNHGTGATRNVGIRNARFGYIAFLDNDDFYVPGRFKTAVEILDSQPGVDGVYEAIGTYPYDEESRLLHIQRMLQAGRKEDDVALTAMDDSIAPEDLFDALIDDDKGWMHLNGTTLRKTIFDKAGLFDEELVWDEDTELYFRLAYMGRLVPGRLKEPVAMRGVYKGNRTLSEEGQRIAKSYHVKMWKKMYHFMLAHPVSRSSSRKILNYYLDFYSNDFANRKIDLTRKFVKLLNLLKTAARHPSIISKIV